MNKEALIKLERILETQLKLKPNQDFQEVLEYFLDRVDEEIALIEENEPTQEIELKGASK